MKGKRAEEKPTQPEKTEAVESTETETAMLSPQTETLKGDIRDEVLREFKSMQKPWQQMTEHEQERVIHRAEDIALKIVMDAIGVIGSRGFEHFDVTLGKITVDKGMIECKFTLPYSDDGIAGVCSRKGASVMLIARDAHEFMGERAKAEPDNVGDLAMPKTGPGAPSDAEGLANVGRGDGVLPPPAQNGTGAPIAA